MRKIASDEKVARAGEAALRISRQETEAARVDLAAEVRERAAEKELMVRPNM